MDVRIGNDIKVEVNLRALGKLKTETICYIKCELVNTSVACYQSHTPNEMILNHCCDQDYYVFPCEKKRQCCKGEAVVKGWHARPTFVTKPDEELKFSIFYAGRNQRVLGSYRLVCQVVAYEKDWGDINLHSYLFDFGEIFNLVDSSTSASGPATITLPNGEVETISG